MAIARALSVQPVVLLADEPTSMLDVGMREAGYGYGVIGDPGPVAFYQKRLDAMDIPKSKPGINAGMLRG